MAAASSLGAVCEQRDQASVFATASSEQDRPAKGSVDKAQVLVPGRNLHPVGITHCTRKLSMWLEAPPPFSWFLIFLHWGSEMINLLILRKWKLFWGYLVLTLSGAFGLDWELLKHFFVRAYLCLFLTVHDFIVQQFSKTTNQRWILFSILL